MSEEIKYGGRGHSKKMNMCFNMELLPFNFPCGPEPERVAQIGLKREGDKYFIMSIDGQPVNIEVQVKKVAQGIIISAEDIMNAVNTIVIHMEYDIAAPKLPPIPEPKYLEPIKMPPRRDRDRQQERLRARYHGRRK